jgi:hypothetical protein
MEVGSNDHTIHFIVYVSFLIIYLVKCRRADICKGSLAAILISHYVIHPTSIYPCRLQILYPFDFTPPPQFIPSHVQLVQACLFQYKVFRLYTDVTVRNKVEEESDLTILELISAF